MKHPEINLVYNLQSDPPYDRIPCSSLSESCILSNLLPQALFHVVTDRARVLTDHNNQVVQFLPDTSTIGQSEHIPQRALRLFLYLPVVSGDRLCTVLPPVGEKKYMLFCEFAVSFNALFGMTCHIIAPSDDPLQRICFFRLIFTVKPPLSSLIS